jgi:small subunit ribosomal protein S20
MAHHKSALKRINIANRNSERNRFYKSSMKTKTKKVLLSKNKEEAITRFNEAASLLDKMVSHGVIHGNTAANKKSRMMKHVNSLT